MIQDMLNPEYYCKSFSIYNTVTKETKVCQGKYQSTVMSEVKIIIFYKIKKNKNLIIFFTA